MMVPSSVLNYITDDVTIHSKWMLYQGWQDNPFKIKSQSIQKKDAIYSKPSSVKQVLTDDVTIFGKDILY